LASVGVLVCANSGGAATATKDYWAIEDAKAREKLPLYQTVPAAKPGNHPANGFST
jgi:hypothetical protein